MKTILFIEDESTLQKTLSAVLEKEDFKIISAMDGEIGLKLIKLKNPDLILLDLILPKLNGFEVLRKIKEDKDTKNIPIIVLTNLETMKDVNKAIELGATTYLVKSSHTLEEVIVKIKQVLSSESKVENR